MNGSQIGVDLESEGKWQHGWRDGVTGTIEFNVYAIALALAVSDKDPNFLKENPAFLTFLAWNLERGMQIFSQGKKLPKLYLSTSRRLSRRISNRQIQQKTPRIFTCKIWKSLV